MGFVTVERDEHIGGFTIILGKNRYHFRGGFTPFNNICSVSISMNKFCTNKVLESEGIPVPKSSGVTLQEFNENTWNIDELTYPLVAKPSRGSACGHNVICNLKNREELVDHIKRNIHMQHYISIEEYQGGLRSFRVLVFYDQVIGVVERIPAHVVGDGVQTIRALIKEQNIIRKKMKATVPTGPIRINQETQTIFEEMGLSIEDIPEKGKVVPIRYICNSTYGGTFVSYKPDIICEENAKLAIKAAQVLNLNLVGFDVLCEDIRTPIETSRGFIIEANGDPDLTIHEQDYFGTKVPVSKIILKKLISKHPLLYFTGRFPIFSIICKTALVVALLATFVWAMATYA